MGDDSAYVAVTATGFVDGACFTDSEDTPRWIAEMKQAGMCVVSVSRAAAKNLWMTNLIATATQSKFGRMIVGRRENGEVEAAGWDVAETRHDAKEWLSRGLSLEFVSCEQVERLAALNPIHVFATVTPAGEVLSQAQAVAALASY